MKWTQSVPWSPASLPEAAWPPTRWAEWMPGVDVVRNDGGEVELAIGGPIPHRALVDADHTPTRLSAQQLEGRARHVGLTLELVDGMLVAEMEIDSPQNIPGSLRRELREQWLQRALEGLTKSA